MADLLQQITARAARPRRQVPLDLAGTGLEGDYLLVEMRPVHLVAAGLELARDEATPLAVSETEYRARQLARCIHVNHQGQPGDRPFVSLDAQGREVVHWEPLADFPWLNDWYSDLMALRRPEKMDELEKNSATPPTGG